MVNTSYSTQSGIRAPWLVDDMLRKGHRCMIATLEGGCKTLLVCWIAVCVASGNPFFGMKTRLGKVLMFDEETPPETVYGRVERFCRGLGMKREDIPNLTIKSMTGFRFGREHGDIQKLIYSMQPDLITVDSIIACLPGGRQGKGENNAETGIAIRDDLNKWLQLSPDSTILITAHSGKTKVENFDIEDYRASSMVGLVRGHGSIVGQACDSGFGLMKISENPNPTRFVIFPKPRRDAIPMTETYVELTEECYGNGWARLIEIDPVPTPPLRIAKALFSVMPPLEEIQAKQFRSTAYTLYAPSEIRLGVEQLLRRKIIVYTKDHFTFKINPELEKEADQQYLEQLKTK